MYCYIIDNSKIGGMIISDINNHYNHSYNAKNMTVVFSMLSQDFLEHFNDIIKYLGAN